MTTSEILLLSIVAFLLIDFAAGMIINFYNEQSKKVTRVARNVDARVLCIANSDCAACAFARWPMPVKSLV